MKRMNPKSRKKFASQGAALQQQRALARWEGEGGASPIDPQMSSLDEDDLILETPIMTTAELAALRSRDERE